MVVADFRSTARASIFDADSGLSVDSPFVKVVAPGTTTRGLLSQVPGDGAPGVEISTNRFFCAHSVAAICRAAKEHVAPP